MSRTAEEWSRLAVSLPGWRWMPGMLSRCSTDTRRAVYRWLVGLDTRHYGLVCVVQDKHGRPCRNVATLQPGPDDLPDLDDPATAGCLLALLGPSAWDNVAPGSAHAPDGEGWWAWVGGEWSEGLTLGRACIAAAAAIGRWPNVAKYGRMEEE
jgi:hypothetical protein